MKLIVFFVAIFAMLSATHSQKVGGITKLEGAELILAKGQLLEALAKISAYGGPSYTIVEVTEVTRQVVAGFIYRYKTVLSDDSGKYNCNVEILNPVVGDSEITIGCVNALPYVRRVRLL